MATFRRIAALKGDASRWRGGARDRLARAAALSPHLSRTGSIRKKLNPILARRDEAERAKRAEERKKREAANTAAQNLAEMRGRLRFLKNMAAASPESASLARRVARLEYKIWKFTLAKTDVPKVIEAYQHALQYSENQTRPELWRDAAAAYISFGSYEGAYKLLCRLVVDFPVWEGVPKVMFTCASILRRLNQWDACASTLLHILRGDPPTPYTEVDVLMHLAWVYEAQAAEEEDEEKRAYLIRLAQEGYINAYSQAREEPGFTRSPTKSTAWWTRHVNRLPRNASSAAMKHQLQGRPLGDAELADRSMGWVSWRSDPNTWLKRGRAFGQGGDPLLGADCFTEALRLRALDGAAPDSQTGLSLVYQPAAPVVKEVRSDNDSDDDDGAGVRDKDATAPAGDGDAEVVAVVTTTQGDTSTAGAGSGVDTPAIADSDGVAEEKGVEGGADAGPGHPKTAWAAGNDTTAGSTDAPQPEVPPLDISGVGSTPPRRVSGVASTGNRTPSHRRRPRTASGPAIAPSSAARPRPKSAAAGRPSKPAPRPRSAAAARTTRSTGRRSGRRWRGSAKVQPTAGQVARDRSLRRSLVDAAAATRSSSGNVLLPRLSQGSRVSAVSSRQSRRSGGSTPSAARTARSARDSIRSMASFTPGTAAVVAQAERETAREDAAAVEVPLPKLDNLFGPDGTVATKNSASGGPTVAARGASPSAASQATVMDAEAARRAAEKARKEEEAALWMEAAQYSLMGGDPGLLVVASEKVVGVTTADDMNAAMMQVLRQADSSKVQRRVMQRATFVMGIVMMRYCANLRRRIRQRKAATAIQRIARGWMARFRARNRALFLAASRVRIQAMYRAWKARAVFRVIKARKLRAIVAIQCAFRQHLARRELLTRRMALRFAFRDRVKKCLLRLQAWVRMSIGARAFRRKLAATLAVQCWWRQYRARQVYNLKYAEAQWIAKMLNQRHWGQVGMVVLPNKYIRQYLKPAQEASLRRTAQRNYHMKQKQARLEYRHSLRASKRDLAIAEQFPEQHPLSQRGGLLDGDSGSDSELLTEHGRIVPRDDDRRGAGIGSSDGRVGPYRTQQHPQTVFEGDSFVQSNQFVAGLAEAPLSPFQAKRNQDTLAMSSQLTSLDRQRREQRSPFSKAANTRVSRSRSRSRSPKKQRGFFARMSKGRETKQSDDRSRSPGTRAVPESRVQPRSTSPSPHSRSPARRVRRAGVSSAVGGPAVDVNTNVGMAVQQPASAAFSKKTRQGRRAPRVHSTTTSPMRTSTLRADGVIKLKATPTRRAQRNVASGRVTELTSAEDARAVFDRAVSNVAAGHTTLTGALDALQSTYDPNASSPVTSFLTNSRVAAELESQNPLVWPRRRPKSDLRPRLLDDIADDVDTDGDSYVVGGTLRADQANTTRPPATPSTARTRAAARSPSPPASLRAASSAAALGLASSAALSAELEALGATPRRIAGKPTVAGAQDEWNAAEDGVDALDLLVDPASSSKLDARLVTADALVAAADREAQRRRRAAEHKEERRRVVEMLDRMQARVGPGPVQCTDPSLVGPRPLSSGHDAAQGASHGGSVGSVVSLQLSDLDAVSSMGLPTPRTPPTALVERLSAEEVERLRVSQMKDMGYPPCEAMYGPAGLAAARKMEKLMAEVMRWNSIDPAHWRALVYKRLTHMLEEAQDGMHSGCVPGNCQYLRRVQALKDACRSDAVPCLTSMDVVNHIRVCIREWKHAHSAATRGQGMRAATGQGLENELRTIAQGVRAQPAQVATHRAAYHKLLLSRLKLSKYREVARVVMHMMDEPGMTPSDTAFRDILHRCAAVRPAMLSAAARQRTSLAREVAARTGATLEETLEAMEQQDQDQNAAWLALRTIEWARAAGVVMDASMFDDAFRSVALTGTLEQAIELFKDMTADGVKPTDETHSALLRLCAQVAKPGRPAAYEALLEAGVPLDVTWAAVTTGMDGVLAKHGSQFTYA